MIFNLSIYIIHNFINKIYFNEYQNTIMTYYSINHINKRLFTFYKEIIYN
jgi:hypothetical protein